MGIPSTMQDVWSVNTGFGNHKSLHHPRIWIHHLASGVYCRKLKLARVSAET
jgi:hypothetical protein